VKVGIDIISLNPDSVLEVMKRLYDFEKQPVGAGTGSARR
jgi:hypothetical protein